MKLKIHLLNIGIKFDVDIDDNVTLADLMQAIKNQHTSPFAALLNLVTFQCHNAKLTVEKTEPLSALGLKEGDELSIDMHAIGVAAVLWALTYDLGNTMPADEKSNPTPVCLALIATRQQSAAPWNLTEVQQLHSYVTRLSRNQPENFPQLSPLHAMLTLLRSQAPVEKIKDQKSGGKFNLCLAEELEKTKPSIPDIAELLDHSFSTLDFRPYGIPEQGVKYIARALENNKTIKKIVMSPNVHKNKPTVIDENDAKALVQMLQRNTQVKSLNLVLCKMAPEVADILIQGLCNNKNLALTELEFYRQNFSDNGIGMLANLLAVNSTLTSLALQRCYINNADLLVLAPSLKINTTLSSLDLGNNSCLNDEGAEVLADVLTVNKGLIFLGLHPNGFSDKGRRALTQALEMNTTFQSGYINYEYEFKNDENLLNLRKEYAKYYTHLFLDSNQSLMSLAPVLERKGHLDFEPIKLEVLIENLSVLEWLPLVLINIIKEYAEGGFLCLASLPSSATVAKSLISHGVLAKKPSLNELVGNIVLNVVEDNKGNVDVHFLEGTLVDQKLLLRNALNQLFEKNKLTGAVVQLSSSAGPLTISGVGLPMLMEIAVIPKVIPKVDGGSRHCRMM